jgi:hypothetical protein
MKRFITAATEKSTIVTSTRVALFVGSVLAAINYGDRIFLHENMGTLDWVKLAVTYCVPYCVATYGAARYAMKHNKDNEPPKII